MKTDSKNTASKRVGPLARGSASGFWRSPQGENHGRDSRPGDVWCEPGDITDTDRMNWLEKYGATPICSRDAIDAAIVRQKNDDEIAYMMGARPAGNAAGELQPPPNNQK